MLTCCPSQEELSRFLREELPTGVAAEIADHIEGCGSCATQLESMAVERPFAWAFSTSADPIADETSIDRAVERESREGEAGGGGSSRAMRPHGSVRIADYEILEEIGRGGHGVVFRAIQKRLGRPVALKLLKRGGLASRDETERFLAEATAVARLRHPAIVQIFDTGTTDETVDGGEPWFAMELLEGGTLAERSRGVPVDGRHAARLVERLARAVAAAHAAGIVHRDLKPGNVLFVAPVKQPPAESQEAPGWSDDELVKVGDFGLAKQIDADAGLTPTEAIVGTPSYMAPEQAAADAKQATPLVDVYGLGAILYELLTGRPPFRAKSTFETLMQVRWNEPVAPRQLQPGLPRDLEVICLKCLEKHPERRYASAELLAEDLGRFIAGRPIEARPPAWYERGAKWCRRNPWRATATGLASLTFLTIAMFVWNTERTWFASRGETLLQSLATVNDTGLPEVIKQLNEVREFADPGLRKIADDLSLSETVRLRAQLALLPVEPGRLESIYEKIDIATPSELRVMQTLFQKHRSSLTPRLWAEVFRIPALFALERTRRACLLAALDPDDLRWSVLGPQVADFVVTESPRLVRDWEEAFLPVRNQLIPRLIEVHRDEPRPSSERLLASTLLSKYVSHDGKQLAELISESDPQQFAVLFPSLQTNHDVAKPILRTMVHTESDSPASDLVRDAVARRRSRATVALIHLGEVDLLDTMLTSEDLRKRGQRDYESGASVAAEVHNEDAPRATSFLIHDLAKYNVPATQVIAALRRCDPKRPEVKSAQLLSLGEFSEQQLTAAMRDEILADLEEAYVTHPDSGVHGALTWLLGQRWGRADRLAELDDRLRRRLPDDGFDWFVDTTGRTFTVFRGPFQAVVGSPAGERYRSKRSESVQRVNIEYDFAISTREETAGDFADARPDLDPVFVRMEAPYSSEEFRNPREPARDVGWFQAVAYARWLSEREGFAKPDDETTCYPPLSQIGFDMTLKSGFLTRPGSRLATRCEWEYACRAGTRTPRFYGHDRSTMDGYAWSLQNADDWPGLVGTLKPNPFGLFDMLGNVWEQTMDCPLEPRGGIAVAVEGDLTGHRQQDAKGGSYLYHAPFIRSAVRYSVFPAGRDYTLGFRLVRTLPRAAETSPGE